MMDNCEEAWEVNEREMYEHVARKAAEWTAKWPAHCTACGGWGCTVYVERHGFTHGAGEDIVDPCGALPDGACHRCGAPDGLSLDGDNAGPCRHCGWNYDDGVPTP